MSKELEAAETLNDFTDILGEDEELEVIPPEKEEEKEEDKEIKEGEEEEEEKEGKEEKIEESELDTVSVKEVNKKYPNFFKEFPHFRHVLFHEREYRELFPTIEEAKESLEDLEGFRELETALATGGDKNTEAVLDAFKSINDEALPEFANNFLPALRKLDQDVYFATITPILVSSIQSMYEAGVRNENENLQNTALVAALHLFGNSKVATGEVKVNSGTKPKKEEKDTTLERERASFRNERYTTLLNDVVQTADSSLIENIKDGIDKSGKMTDGMKDLLAERVSKEIKNILSSNKIHSARMDALWKKAGEANFSSAYKSKIVAAYLEAAGQIMPKIRAKIRANTLGIRDRQPETNGGSEKREPKNSAGSGGSSRSSSSSSNGKDADPKKINWKKTSDVDFLKDNVTLKS